MIATAGLGCAAACAGLGEGSSPGACRTAAMSLLAPLAAGTLPFWPQIILADDGSAASKPPGLIPPSVTRDLSCACCLQAVTQAPGRGGRGHRGRGPPSRGGRSQDHGRSPGRGRSGGRGGRGCSGPPAHQQQQVRVHSSAWPAGLHALTCMAGRGCFWRPVDMSGQLWFCFSVSQPSLQWMPARLASA